MLTAAALTRDTDSFTSAGETNWSNWGENGWIRRHKLAGKQREALGYASGSKQRRNSNRSRTPDTVCGGVLDDLGLCVLSCGVHTRSQVARGVNANLASRVSQLRLAVFSFYPGLKPAGAKLKKKLSDIFQALCCMIQS